MEQLSYYINTISFGGVVVLWFVFAGVFLSRKRAASSRDKIGVPSSFIGLALQGAGFGLVWAFRRSPLFSPVVDSQYLLNIVFQVLAVLIAASSVWLAMAAIRELGRQWSLEARLIEDHQLITSGVYQVVRHPIYTAMLGMLLATGLAFSHWVVILAAIVVFIVGTKIRTSIEERLLGDAFGQEFETWRAKVPGLIPFVKI
jgi:protein-S-isoprenylcysteine O-methyltransferase Ste14